MVGSERDNLQEVLVYPGDFVDETQKYAKPHGAITLRGDALAKVLAGLTSLEEAIRVTIYFEYPVRIPLHPD